MKRLFVITIAMVLLLASNGFAQDANAILGKWYTEGGKAQVEIYKSDDVYYGKIVWLKEPKNENGTDKMDIHNPDPSKKRNPVIGLNIVHSFKYKGNNKWVDGKIYDPDNGKTYSCKMKLKGNELKVRGFIGISLLGRTTVWTRKS
jgi:uncharacterized protein (DUF2147 family)